MAGGTLLHMELLCLKNAFEASPPRSVMTTASQKSTPELGLSREACNTILGITEVCEGEGARREGGEAQDPCWVFAELLPPGLCAEL